jgi:predicted 3-demethylubiquinone-9 3-methyltransferase (glyoxalase superfamily)
MSNRRVRARHAGKKRRTPREEPAMPTKISPCLWFDSQAEEAAKFYTSIFPKSKILRTVRNPEGARGPAGAVLTVEFELDGQRFTGLNGGPDFQFTEAISFVVHCETQKEVDSYWDALLAGGTPSQCGWLKDQYGVSWQIVPTVLPELLGDPDPRKAQRVMEAMLKMIKLDIEALKKAHDTA